MFVFAGRHPWRTHLEGNECIVRTYRAKKKKNSLFNFTLSFSYVLTLKGKFEKKTPVLALAFLGPWGRLENPPPGKGNQAHAAV